MSYLDLIITAIALSMDAFAVSICKGLSTSRVRLKHSLISGAWFGGFQGLMPLIGFLVGSLFAVYVTAVDHWIAFGLLGFLGFNMLKEALFDKDEDECSCNGEQNEFGFKIMLTMAVATSIDALAVGINYAFMSLNTEQILFAVSAIGVITFILSGIGVKVGAVFGAKFKKPAEIAGGIILIGMGIKILIEHLFFS